MGSSVLVQGDFDDCLELMMRDIDRERVLKGYGAALCDPERNGKGADAADEEKSKKGKRPVVYFAGPERFTPDAAERYAAMKALCLAHGLEALSPLDPIPGEASIATGDPLVRAGMLFARYASHVRACDIIIANLEDFHGWEPNADVSFECGMAWQLGKTCIGHMPDTRIMRERIPHFGPEKNNKDIYGNDVENFCYPINLMFSSSMPIVEGNFEAALKKVLRIISLKGK
jgi:nucleoside 2-deoxyribosyltransferase